MDCELDSLIERSASRKKPRVVLTPRSNRSELPPETRCSLLLREAPWHQEESFSSRSHRLSARCSAEEKLHVAAAKGQAHDRFGRGEAFFQSLPLDRLLPREQELLVGLCLLIKSEGTLVVRDVEALPAIKKRCEAILPRGVRLADWMAKRIPDQMEFFTRDGQECFGAGPCFDPGVMAGAPRRVGRTVDLKASKVAKPESREEVTSTKTKGKGRIELIAKHWDKRLEEYMSTRSAVDGVFRTLPADGSMTAAETVVIGIMYALTKFYGVCSVDFAHSLLKRKGALGFLPAGVPLSLWLKERVADNLEIFEGPTGEEIFAPGPCFDGSLVDMACYEELVQAQARAAAAVEAAAAPGACRVPLSDSEAEP